MITRSSASFTVRAHLIALPDSSTDASVPVRLSASQAPPRTSQDAVPLLARLAPAVRPPRTVQSDDLPGSELLAHRRHRVVGPTKESS